jgi:molecular chaperone IbpA
MRNFDLSPLYRSAIGFDRLFNLLENNQNQSNGGYPPYNVELVDENHYRIAIAVAGSRKANWTSPRRTTCLS